MTGSRRFPLPRALASLLVLLAAFAYPLRSVPDAGSLGMHHPATSAHMAHTEGREEQSPAPHSPGAHADHCLFCLTGAFATAPERTAPPLPPAERPARDPDPTPRAGHTLPAHADARAPPRAPA